MISYDGYKYIRDPDYIALVVEDKYQPSENGGTGTIIRSDRKVPTPKAGNSIIVETATWKLQTDFDGGQVGTRKRSIQSYWMTNTWMDIYLWPWHGRIPIRLDKVS
jgi:hypothetical protein